MKGGYRALLGMYRVKYREKKSKVTAVTQISGKSRKEVIDQFKRRGYEVINIEKSGWGWSATAGKKFKKKDKINF